MKIYKTFTEYKELFEAVKPIKMKELMAKVKPLVGKIKGFEENDWKSMAYVGTKADVNKFYKELEKLGVAVYFDQPFKDESGKPGTWMTNTAYAEDEGLIENLIINEDDVKDLDAKWELFKSRKYRDMDPYDQMDVAQEIEMLLGKLLKKDKKNSKYKEMKSEISSEISDIEDEA